MYADGKHPGADQSFFQRREFCFTLENDIFVRYQSFKVGETAAPQTPARARAHDEMEAFHASISWRRQMCPIWLQDGAELASALSARLPAKIDIGPVYSADPAQRKTYGGAWLRELCCRCLVSACCHLVMCWLVRCRNRLQEDSPCWWRLLTFAVQCQKQTASSSRCRASWCST